MNTTTNFPNATADEWTQAHRIMASAAMRAGYDHSTADDLAAEAVLRIVAKPWRVQPESVRHAACILRKAARRYGWAMFDRQARRASQRKADAVRPIMDRGGMITPSPADMAERAEALGVSIHRVHEACGVGAFAMQEPGTTPSVYGHGPGHQPPQTGCRAIRLETDPNAERTLRATHRSQPQAAALEGENLARYCEALAAYRGE